MSKHKLKQSTIKKYNVFKLCHHIESFQINHNLSLYRFDFQYNKIYKWNKSFLGESYTYETNIDEINRDVILYILNDVYTKL